MKRAKSWTKDRLTWATDAAAWAAAGALVAGVAKLWVFSRYYYAGGYYLYGLLMAAVAGVCGTGAMASLPRRFGPGPAYLAGVAVPATVIIVGSLFIARDFAFGGPVAYTAAGLAWAVATLLAWLAGGIIRWLMTLAGR